MGLLKTGFVFGLGFVTERVVRNLANDPEIRKTVEELRKSSKNLVKNAEALGLDLSKGGRVAVGEYAELLSRVCDRVAEWAKEEKEEKEEKPAEPDQETNPPQRKAPEETPGEADAETPAK